MKKAKYLLLLAACTLVLSSCGKTDEPSSIKSPIIIEEEPTASTPVESESPTSEPVVTTPVIEEDVPPAEGMVRSYLTNEWVTEEVAKSRPIAVMTPNQSAAIPHYNLSNASILYEANVEGNMTRMMAVYEDWKDMEKIGNVRSLRTYYAFWAFEWDAVIVHYGGPWMIDEILAKPDAQSINGVTSDSGAFFRSNDRPQPHNAYTSGALLQKYMQNKGYSLEDRGLRDEHHFQFASKDEPNTLEQYETGARNANTIDMTGAYPLTRCYFEYNEEDGLYYRYQHLSGASDGPHMDAVTGEQLKFTNVLVQNTKQEDIGLGYLVMACHDTTRDGWFFTRGKGIHVTWKKTSDFGATRFYDDNGNEVTLNTGKTMICVIEDGDTFSFK